MQELQAIGIVLLLISIGTVAAPVGAVLVMYHDNLIEIVIPPEINDIINSNNIIQDNLIDVENGGFEGSGQSPSLMPTIVDVQTDVISRTFSVTVNFTNTFNFNLTLNNLSANLECTQHHYVLGSANIRDSVFIPAGKTTLIVVTGFWTQDAESHFLSQHLGTTSIDVDLANLDIDVNGINIKQTEPINIGSVPIF